MAFDRIPVSLIEVGNEAEVITWDAAGEPTTVSLGLGDFIFRDATGALVNGGALAAPGQVMVADGLGNWAPADQTGAGPTGSGVGSFEVDRRLYFPATPVVDPANEFDPGVTTEIQLPIEPNAQSDVLIFFDATVQGLDAFSLTDNLNPGTFDTATFTNPVPNTVSIVEVMVFGRPAAIDIVFDPSLVVGPPDIVTGLNVQEAIDQLDTYLVNLDATQVAFDDTLLGSGAANVQEAIDAMATTPGLLPTPFADLLMLVRDERPSGTDGGDALENVWTPRVLNTEDINGIPGASLAANQITLPDGEYFIEWIATFNSDADGPIGDVRTRLHNITDNATEIVSLNMTTDGGATIQPSKNSNATGRLTVAGGPKVFELQYMVQYQAPVRGLGKAVNMGIPEVYTIMKIWQV